MSSNQLLTERHAALEILRVLHNHDRRIVRIKLVKESTPKRRGGVVMVPYADAVAALESIGAAADRVDALYRKLHQLAETYWAALS